MSSEVEDLFGDDVIVQPDTGKIRNDNSDEPLSDQDDLFGDEQVLEHEERVENIEEEKEEVSTEVVVPNIRAPKSDAGTIYLAKLPSFLDINALPYDPDLLLTEIQQSTAATADNDERMTKKRSLVNTLRWKHKTLADGSETRQSNARFVRWSDGTMSLQVGEELFDVPIKDMLREHSYLTLMHAEEGLLRGIQRFSNSMTFQPFGLSSKSHAELKADIARRAISSKGRTVKLHTEMIDPADFQKQAIKADNEKQKARRRLDNQKARVMGHSNTGRDRTQLTARYLDDSDEELNNVRQSYAEDDDDGFVEDDEDDQDSAGRERLQALKDAGAAEYRNRNRNPKKVRRESDEELDSGDESIVYEDGGEDVSEEEAVMTPKRGNSPVAAETVPRNRKLKRRIVDSDDDSLEE